MKQKKYSKEWWKKIIDELFKENRKEVKEIDILDQVFEKPTVGKLIKLSNEIKNLKNIIKEFEDYFNDLNKQSKKLGLKDIEDLIKEFKKKSTINIEFGRDLNFNDELSLRIEEIKQRYGKSLKDSTWSGVEDTIKKTKINRR